MAYENDNKIKVKYVLYSHYAYNDEHDFKDWSDRDDPSNLSGLKGILYLESRLKELGELLDHGGQEGLLVLFYKPGLKECFDAIAAGLPLDDNRSRLEFAKEVRSYVDQIINDHRELRRRVRFITAEDLVGIFDRLGTSREKKRLLRWIGHEESYDTTKIVEAIVHLRLLGTGIPVFRVDWDVLFREEPRSGPRISESEDANHHRTRLGFAIATCVKAYELRLKDPSVATFVFSASYDTDPVRDKPSDFESWRGAYATRVLPAILVPKEAPDDKKPDSKREVDWDQYARDNFSQRVAQDFYGLKWGKPNASDETDHWCVKFAEQDGSFMPEGIIRVGGNPLVSVISGALLCQSDTAIIDLPPFSNFRENVTWIDDHLRYSLYRELRQFTSGDLMLVEAPRLSDAKLDHVKVNKARGSTGFLPGYVLGTYLPTLLWGTVVDAWINPNPVLKCRPNELAGDDRKKWDDLQKDPSNALLPSYLQYALEHGQFDEQALRRRLKSKGMERINDVRRMWANLKEGSGDSAVETFASIWANGNVERYYPKFADDAKKEAGRLLRLDEAARDADRAESRAKKAQEAHRDAADSLVAMAAEGAQDKILSAAKQLREAADDAKRAAKQWRDAKGCVEKADEELRETRAARRALGIPQQRDCEPDTTLTLDELNPALRHVFDRLVDDAVQYIEWTLYWPTVVRMVRSIRQGTLPTDMTWPLEEPAPRSMNAGRGR